MNKSTHIRLYIPLLIFITLFSCENMVVKERGNGNIETKEIELESFNGINLSGGFEVTIEEGNAPLLIIETDENLIPYIKTEIRGGNLDIYTSESISSRKGVKLHIVYTELEEIEVSGAVALKNEGILRTEDLELAMSGAGGIDIELEASSLELRLAGAGAVELAGNVGQQRIIMSGAGGLDAFDLISKECDINISGVGGAEIYVTERLDAQVSGIGGISYRGNPSDITRNVSGLGSIDKDD